MLWDFSSALAAHRFDCGSQGAGMSPMKPIPIASSPTRNRALNAFLGMVLSLASILLFLALATYHSTDPSLNTSSAAEVSKAVSNWIGLFGAYLSDLTLQTIGITAFLLPLWLGGLGWT